MSKARSAPVRRVDDWVGFHASARPEALAASGALECSYAQLERLVDGVAWSFRQLGMRAQQRVVLRAHTSPELLLALLGLWRLGCSAVPVHPALSAQELLQIQGDCEANHLVLGRPDEALASLVKQTQCWSVHSLPSVDAWRLERTQGTEPPEAPELDPLARSSGDEAVVLYTSGTTGVPNGVPFSHAQLLDAERGLRSIRPLSSTDRYLHTAPLHHVAGLEFCIATLAVGGVQVFDPLGPSSTKTPESIFRTLLEARANVAFLVPTLLARLLEYGEATAEALPHLRLLVYGGAPTPLPLLSQAIQRFPLVLAQGYGLTEACGAVTWLGTEQHAKLDPQVHASAGTLLPELKAQVVSCEGAPVGHGEYGELWVRGTKVASSYVGRNGSRSGEAHEVFSDEGWLRTGDLGYFDASARWVIVDRLKDLIISGGENIASREVEKLLLGHPEVLEVAAVGAPSESWGEEVTAFVVLRKPDQASEALAQDLIRFAKLNGASFKAPKRILWCNELPKSAAGKVDKKLLRAALNSRL